MVIDTSALLAILLQEPEASLFSRKIEDTSIRICSAVSLLEASIILLGRQGQDSVTNLDELIRDSGIRIVPFDASQVRLAREAFQKFGKGRHPARLNFGDCASYALARSQQLPLLYKGEDFARTDLASAAS